MPDKPLDLIYEDQGPRLDTFVPFSTRYGLSNILEDHKGTRHTFDHREINTNLECEPNLKKRCICPGPLTMRTGCCESATQEDRLCDSCRMFCYAVVETTVDQRLVRLVKELGEYKWEQQLPLESP